MPFSSNSPRSSNARPEPATRSRVVADASTSPAPACGRDRARRCAPRSRAASRRRPLDLARVNARAHLEPELGQAVADRERAADRARRAVEQRQEPVAGGVDLLAAEALELAPHQLRGGARAARPRRDRRARRARSVEPTRSVKRIVASTRSARRAWPHAGEELLDLVDDVVRVPERHVRVARELDEPRAGDVRGDVAALLDPRVAVAEAVDDERRRLDRRQHVANVGLRVHQHEVARRARARRGPRARHPPALERRRRRSAPCALRSASTPHSRSTAAAYAARSSAVSHHG